MLRDTGVPNAEEFGQLADGPFALDELTEDE